MKPAKQNRRKFIKQSAIGTTGLLLASNFPLIGSVSSPAKSKVIIAHSNYVIDKDGKVDPELLQKLMDQSMLKLTDKKKLSKAWKKYFTDEDIIGLKVNANSYSVLKGTPMTEHYSLITNAIFNSFQHANLSSSNAIIWERSDKELIDLGYSIQKDPGKLRTLGTYLERRPGESESYQPGYSTINHLAGDKTTRFTNILENDCTALINLPALKSHRLAGVTGALKNHYGSIDNPRDFHENDCCNPGIAELNNIDVIRSKHRLVICNALMGLWDGGPRWDLSKMWMEGSLIVGEDPVAVDKVMLQLVDEKRKEAGLESVSKRAKHLRLCEEIGLGNSKLENIEIIHLEI